MKPTTCLLLSFFLTASLKAQQSCNCPETLSRLQQLIKKNYAGFADKFTPKTKPAHDAAYKRLYAKAAQVNKPSSCIRILEEYIAYWNDKHLYLAGEILATAETNKPNWYALDSIKAQAYFEKNASRLDAVEGFWNLEDAYNIAIVQDPKKQKGSYVGVVMRAQNPDWKQGMVKMTLRKAEGNYYDVSYVAGGFGNVETQSVLSNDILDISMFGPYKKAYPPINNVIAATNYQSPFPQSDVDFRFPDDSTAILMLSNFYPTVKPALDSMMLANKQALESRPNWIIDLRYNGGGGTGTYENVLPYFYTNPIIRSGSKYWLSPDNISKYEEISSSNLPQNIKDFFSGMVAAGRNKPNTWFPNPGDTFRFASIAPYPKKIVVLAGKKTSSSAEIFLMDARQSKKVTILGEYSEGVVDYGDGARHKLPCADLEVSIPVRRSNYLDKVKYDGIGVKPDVFVPKHVRDWYLFVKDYWAKNEKKK